VECIDSGQVHLWLAHLCAVTDPQLLAEYRSLLSGEELRQQARFHFERDRHRYLVTRAMVRSVLSNYSDVAPSNWHFAVNAYGKPSIAARHAAEGRVEFNVSHTDGLVVLGVACERAIGVDVENLRACEVDIEIANRYFAPAEVAALLALRREQQQRRFFEYWTLKEAYIKARGTGLALPLNLFAFDLDGPSGIRLTMDASLGDRPERWVFEQLLLGQDHMVAVCVENGGVDPPCFASVRCW
jgi:4'-phosphopantetheinyl transferase